MCRSMPRIALIVAALLAFNSFTATALQAQHKFVIAKISGDAKKPCRSFTLWPII
jgi:hypothetical protein